MRPNEIKPDELELLLNEAECGVAGQLLRSASENIEASPRFAQELETRLLASASSRPQPTPQSKDVRTGIMGRLTATSGGKANRSMGRILPLAFGGLGVAAMVLLLVGMAAMLNLRQQAADNVAPNYTCGVWSVVSSPNVDTVNQLTSVAAISNDDVWAVGYHNAGNSLNASGTSVPDPDSTLIMHWDGKTWNSVPSPNVSEGTYYNRLFSISAVSANDVWAVGYYTDVDPTRTWKATVEQTLVLHWDGSEWKLIAGLPTTGDVSSLATVAALASDDVWVGGYFAERAGTSSNEADHHPLLIHWDGKVWTQIVSSPINSLRGWVYSLEAIAPNDIWVAGLSQESTKPLMLHWDGTSWEQRDTPINNVGSLSIKNMAAASKDDVWAVGQSTNESNNSIFARMSHWDGKTWTDSPAPTANNSMPFFSLYDAIAPTSDAAWAVGFHNPQGSGDNNSSSPMIMRWDGKEWSYVQSSAPDALLASDSNALPKKKITYLSSIAAVPGGDIWAVGAAWDDQGGKTLIVRYSPGPCATPTSLPVANKTPDTAPDRVDTLKLIPSFKLLDTLSMSRAASSLQDLQMAWSPMGHTLAATSGSDLLLWDAKISHSIATVPLEKVGTIAFSPDGSLLAAGLQWSARDGGGVQLIDPMTGRKGHYLLGETRAVGTFQVDTRSITWSPDSKYLATASEEPFSSSPPPGSMDGVIRVWDVATGKEAQTIKSPSLEGRYGWVSKVAWSPAGNRLAALSSGGVLRLWDPLTGQVLHHLATNPMYDIASVKWSPDGRTLAVVAIRQVELWDAASGKLLRKLPEGLYNPPTPVPTVQSAPDETRTEEPGPPSDYYGANSLLWSPESKTLITTDGGHVRVWDVTSGEVMRIVQDRAYWLALSPDGRVLATASWGEVILRDVSSGEEIRKLPYVQGRYMAWSPDGRMLAITSGVPSPELEIVIWGVRSQPESGITTPPTPPTPPTPRQTAIITPESVPTRQAPTAIPPTLVPPVAGWATPSVGGTMPDFASVDVRTGEAITISSLRGKLLVLTFWGAWCPPCKDELPLLQKAYETYGRDVQFLNVSMQPRDKIETVRDFVTQNGYTWRFTHAETNSSASSLVSALPTTLFIYKDGTVLAIHTGKKSAEQLEGYLRQLIVSPLSTPALPTAQPTASTPQAACGEWSIVDRPNVDTVNELAGVVAISANDVWAVGYHSTGRSANVESVGSQDIDATLTMHWDGKTWRSVSSPNVEGGKMHNRLTSVSAVSANDVWAVGSYGNYSEDGLSTSSTSKTLVLHWDGNEWKIIPTRDVGKVVNHLETVVALAEDNVWTAGYFADQMDPLGKFSTLQTLILQWNGNTWKQVSSPNPGPYGNRLHSLAATSKDDIWAVGVYSVDPPKQMGLVFAQPLMLHWDGKIWSQGSAPTSANYVLSVTAVSSNNVWAVGSYSTEGSNEPKTFRWDGNNWAEVPVPLTSPSPFNPPAQDYPSDIVALSADDIWLVGSYIAPAAESASHTVTSPLLVHWNGRDWTHTYVSLPPIQDNVQDRLRGGKLNSHLEAVAAAPGGDLWAVGHSADEDIGIVNSLIMRYTPSPCGTPTATP